MSSSSALFAFIILVILSPKRSFNETHVTEVLAAISLISMPQSGLFLRSAVSIGALALRADAMQPVGGDSARATPEASVQPDMEKISKRKASSPLESLKTKVQTRKVVNLQPILPPKIHEMASNVINEMDTGASKSAVYRILTRNGEEFKGGLDRVACMKIWIQGLQLAEKLVYGIALVQIPKKPFLAEYQLREPVDLEEIPQKFEVTLAGVVYTGELLMPKSKPPALGEEVEVTIKRTRFKLWPEDVQQWLVTFGKIVKAPDFQDADDYPTIKSDDIVCTMVLRKHIPGLLPAFGRKMMVYYRGQPIQCGRCFEFNHIRKECENENIEWLAYAKYFLKENYATKEMLGSWVDLINSK